MYDKAAKNGKTIIAAILFEVEKIFAKRLISCQFSNHKIYETLKYLIEFVLLIFETLKTYLPYMFKPIKIFICWLINVDKLMGKNIKKICRKIFVIRTFKKPKKINFNCLLLNKLKELLFIRSQHIIMIYKF